MANTPTISKFTPFNVILINVTSFFRDDGPWDCLRDEVLPRLAAAREVAWEHAQESRYYDVHITPLNGGNGRPLGVSVAYIDVTRLQDLQAQLNRSRQDLETAYELQSTNEDLETAYEELQSTNEELETTNEELQCTLEELETTNEELQPTNEELQTMNQELRDRGHDLNRANSFLESILSGVRAGVVVLDRELHVTGWNRRAEDLWRLRGDEVRGLNFLNLDIGLPTDQLRNGIREAMSNDGAGGFREMTVPATNRRGRTISCKVTVTPLVGSAKEIRGAILMMEEEEAARTQTEEALALHASELSKPS